MGGADPQGITRVEQTVSSRLMESQLWCLPAGSVALWGEDSEKEQWPLTALMSWRKLSPRSRLDTRHFSSSLYASSAFQAAAPVLKLRGNEAE